MTQTITRQFDHDSGARDAVAQLKRENFSDSEISLIAPAGNGHGDTGAGTTAAVDDAGIGAGIGGAAGAGVGLLTGLGVMAIPGVGPVVAAGWLASLAVGALAGAVAGAATGGIVGSLTGEGVSEDDAHVYAEGVRRGASLVTVRTDDSRAPEATRILDAHHPIDVAERGTQYRAEGWQGFDEKAPPFTRPDQTATMARPVVDGITPPRH